ncbi:hypothetical protein HDU78_004299 [Chytriomyces hyalinus]|nr:hypothetical protein HDU78_004299 [Chytriomyces hyalinus]
MSSRSRRDYDNNDNDNDTQTASRRVQESSSNRSRNRRDDGRSRRNRDDYDADEPPRELVAAAAKSQTRRTDRNDTTSYARGGASPQEDSSLNRRAYPRDDARDVRVNRDDRDLYSTKDTREQNYEMSSANANKYGYPEDTKWNSEAKSGTLHSDDYLLNESDYGTHRKGCCCIPRSKKGKIICGVVVTVVVIFLAVVLFFFIPRYPEIRVNAINLKNFDTGAFTFSTPGDNGNLNEMTFSLSLVMDVSTYNPNLYSLTVDRIDLTAQMMANTTYLTNPLKVSPLSKSFAKLTSLVAEHGSPPKANQKPSGYTPSSTADIGTGLVQGIKFPSKTWVNYTMVFNLNYTPDPYVGLLNDPTVQEIADACGITSRYHPPGRPMKIHYEAATTISLLKPLGYVPGVSNDIMIACPIQVDQIDRIVSAVDAGNDPMTALKSVLSAPPQ